MVKNIIKKNDQLVKGYIVLIAIIAFISAVFLPLLLAGMIVFTAGTIVTGGNIMTTNYPIEIRGVIYTAAVASTTGLLGYRFKRCYDELKKQGEV